MNEEVGAVVETAAEQVTENSEAVIESVQDMGSVAVTSVTETANSFVQWIKGFCTYDNLFRIIGAAIIIGAIYLIYKIAVRAVKKVPVEKLSVHKSALILRGLQYIFYFLVIMYVLSLFGVSLSAIWGAAGVAGVAIAFAAQTSVSNIISGIFIVAEKTMKIGDLITVGNETGIVDTIGLLSVQIHTLDNQLIRIPNSTIINSNMVNTSYFPKRRMTIGVSVSYDTDMEQALEALEKVPAMCKTVLKDPSPAAWFDKFDESGINLTLAVWFNSTDFLKAKNEVFIGIKKVFDEAKIEIPYNKLDVKFLGTDAGDVKVASAKKTVKKPAAKKTAKK